MSASGSSRMKGGSMTAILLEIVFTTAIARTFSLPLQDIITKGNPTITPHLPLPLHQMPAGSKEGVKMNRTVSNSSRGDKEITKTTSTYSTSIGQSQIATLVDAFMSTYNAAYRSVYLTMGIVYAYVPVCLFSTTLHPQAESWFGCTGEYRW